MQKNFRIDNPRYKKFFQFSKNYLRKGLRIIIRNQAEIAETGHSSIHAPHS
jgi:hypothetical protein